MPKLDQQVMVDIRSAWFEEVGGAPNGNRREEPPPLRASFPHPHLPGILQLAYLSLHHA